MSTVGLKWNTSSADIPRTQENLDFVEYKIKEKYCIEEYLIASETDPKDHFHLVGFTTKQNWDNFIKCLVEKFNLRRTDGKRGGKNFYATLNKPIDTIERLKIYCTKQCEGNTENMRSSLDYDTLMAYYEQSFIKNNKKKLDEEVHEFLETTYEKEVNLTFRTLKSDMTQIDIKHEIIKNLRMKIINYLRLKKIKSNKSSINNYIQHHLYNTTKYLEYDIDNLIYTLHYYN